MSHFSTTPLAISNRDDLIAAIQAAGYTAILPAPGEDTVEIIGWGGARRRAALKLGGEKLGHYRYEIGFRFDEPTQTFVMVADWMGAPVRPFQLAEQLANEAAVAASLAELALLGYDTSEITVSREDGQIRILAGQSPQLAY